MTSGEKGGGATPSPWTPRDDDERAAVVALCVETAKRSSTHTSAQLTRVAEATVPPVPTPEPEYNTHKGVTYRDGTFVDADGCDWVLAAECIQANCAPRKSDKQPTLTDDDHAALMELKANPVKVAAKPLSTCILCNGTGYVTKHSTSANGGSVSSAKCLCHSAPLVMNTTAATVAGEPVVEPHRKTARQLVRSALLDAVIASDSHGTATGYSSALERIGDALIVALTPTPADAVALLVREGWLDLDSVNVFSGKVLAPHGLMIGNTVRVLIAPTTTGAAHE